MSPIHATYENGVFRPLTAVDLPEHCEVTVVPRIEKPQSHTPPPIDREKELKKLYEILNQCFESGFTDTAARHNELEP